MIKRFRIRYIDIKIIMMIKRVIIAAVLFFAILGICAYFTSQYVRSENKNNESTKIEDVYESSTRPGPSEAEIEEFQKKHKVQDGNNFRGRRMPDVPRDFKIIYLCFSDEEEKVSIDISFTEGINPDSIKIENILINDRNYPTAEILFTKNGHGLKLLIEKEKFDFSNQNYKIQISGVESFTGQKLGNFKKDNISMNLNYFLRRNEEWKKS